VSIKSSASKADPLKNLEEETLKKKNRVNELKTKMQSIDMVLG